MRILLTNDDGYDAPGFAVLQTIAARLAGLLGGAELWCVAPESNQSGIAHALTLHDPLRVRHVAERHYRVSGTPTDCVIMAVSQLMPERPDLILSGVNLGQNAGDDVTYSGTIAAAIEGTLLGVPSVALSQMLVDEENGGSEAIWACAETYAPGLIGKIFERGIQPGQLININFPACQPEDVAGTRLTRQGSSTHGIYAERREDGRRRSYYWLCFHRRIATVGTDCDLDALQKGFVSVTPLKLDLTDDAGLAHLSDLEFAP